MIANDDELRITQERLGLAEAALMATHRDFGHNPTQYRLFSEPAFDLIRSMRADIDAYLGLAPAATAAVTISLEGREVALGKTSAGLVTRFVDAFRRGLQSVVEVLEAGPRAANRRRAGWIERACDLPLLGVSAGSVQVTLGRPEADEPGLFSDEERQNLSTAFDVLFGGLEWAAGDAAASAFDDLPPDKRQAVLNIVTRLLPPRSGPVERVSFGRPINAMTRRERSATLDRHARQRVREEAIRLAEDRQYSEVPGVIRIINLDNQTFVLRDLPEGTPELWCDYGPQTEEIVKQYLDCRVMVSGTLETNRVNNRQRMEVETIEPLGSEDVGGADDQ